MIRGTCDMLITCTSYRYQNKAFVINVKKVRAAYIGQSKKYDQTKLLRDPTKNCANLHLCKNDNWATTFDSEGQ